MLLSFLDNYRPSIQLLFMESLVKFHRQLETMRPALIRFALIRMRNKDAAEESLLAVLEKPDQFEGRSSLLVYVTAILKFKIIDHSRDRKKETILDRYDNDFDTLAVDNQDIGDGYKNKILHSPENPENTMQEQDFFRLLEHCLDNMPEKYAKVFVMHEWLEFDTNETCHELNLTTSHLYVLLYRARLRLSKYLSVNWFGDH